MTGNLKSIGDYAFSGCASLASVTLPAKITSTGNSTFLGCASLTSITIPNKVTRIGDYAFSGCTSLANVTIPSSVTSIGAGAFLGCTSLVNISIPGSVVSIGYEAFSGCTGLAGVFFTGGAPSSVDSDVFLGAANAKVYYYSGATGWNSTFSDRPTVLLTVPLIAQTPTDQYALAGSKTAFSVSAFGPPPIKYQWQFNGANISGGRSATLGINSAQSKNEGSYTVVVANSYGSVTSSPALLFVKAVAGTYKGLILAGNSFDNTNSGAFVITVSSGGAFSAKLTFPSQNVSGSGKLVLYAGQAGPAAAHFTKQIGGRNVDVLFMIALDSSTAVSGSLTALGDTNSLAQIDGAMVANTTDLGLFNVAVLSATTNSPAGHGYGSVNVSTTGVKINQIGRASCRERV
jgi:hypothetical protein